MNLSEAVEKLKVLLGKEPDEPIVTTEQKFTDQVLNDGVTTISYDAEELAVGVVVSIVDSQRQKQPLPVGDYVTEAGDTFSVVDDMGTIDNVVVAPEPIEPVEPTDAPVTPVAQATQVYPDKAGNGANVVTTSPKRVIKSQVEEHVFNAFKDEVTATIGNLTADLTKLETENAELKSQLEKGTEVSKQIFSIVSQIADEPSKQPTESKQKFSATSAIREYKQSIKDLEKELTQKNINN